MAGAGAAGLPRPLIVETIHCLAAEGFWDALRRLKLDVLATDDSPIPITGPPRSQSPTRCSCLPVVIQVCKDFDCSFVWLFWGFAGVGSFWTQCRLEVASIVSFA